MAKRSDRLNGEPNQASDDEPRAADDEPRATSDSCAKARPLKYDSDEAANEENKEERPEPPHGAGDHGSESNSGGARPRERERQPSEHHKVSVKPDALDATDAEERKAVIVLQPSELALN